MKVSDQHRQHLCMYVTCSGVDEDTPLQSWTDQSVRARHTVEQGEVVARALYCLHTLEKLFVHHLVST